MRIAGKASYIGLLRTTSLPCQPRSRLVSHKTSDWFRRLQLDAPNRQFVFGEAFDVFDRIPKRLDDEAVLMATLRVLHSDGFDRARIEEALIRQAPVDLDLMAQCYKKLIETQEQRATDAFSNLNASKDRRNAA